MIRGQTGRYGPSRRMAQDHGPVDPQGIEHIHRLARPQREAVLPRMIPGAQAEPITVEGDHATRSG